MSRTKRIGPKAHHNAFSNRYYGYELKYLDNVWSRWKYQSLDKGGWNEARRVLPKDEYNHMKKMQGDCFSKRMKHLSPPKHYRKKVEKCSRQFSNKEIKHWLKNADYEINNDSRYRLVDGWCWF